MSPDDTQHQAPPSASISAPSLQLENICHGYKEGEQRIEVLTEASMMVRPGEMVGLVAPSGSGKSTLLHIAGLLETPNTGQIYINGLAAHKMTDRQRTEIRRLQFGFVYQFHHLLPELSAIENVIMPQLLRGLSFAEANQRARELMAYLQIDHRLHHRPTELSGGEQQRVAIARAVANAPRILLADEPTGNLDPKTSLHVFSALQALVKGTGLAALIATHNIDLASRMTRRISIHERMIVDVQ